MLDFEREDESLQGLVGADARRILTEASVGWADRFYLARERMDELAADRQATPEVALERDRLASYFGCAYGRNGLLARAGALLSLRDRLQRLAFLAPRLVDDAPGMARLRREALIVRTFAHERLARDNPHPDEIALFELVKPALGTLLACADFVASAAAVDADQGGFSRFRGVSAAADLAFLASGQPPARPLLALAAFALARLSDRMVDGAVQAPAWDALIDSSLRTLRQDLWDATEALYAEQDEPASLESIEQADLALEALMCHLSDRRAGSAVRARLLAELWALVAASRAGLAARRAGVALDGALLLLAEGLAVESKERRR